MKKVKIISALMAAVLAAVPVTGVANNVSLLKTNPIVANADSAWTKWDLSAAKTTYLITSKTTNKYQTVYASDTKPFLKNGDWYLFLKANGDLVSINIRTNRMKYVFDAPERIGKRHPVTGRKINYYKLYMQGDGNFVVYANGDLSMPFYHTHTYDSGYNVDHGCSFIYSLTSNGNLSIVRQYPNGMPHRDFWNGKFEVLF